MIGRFRLSGPAQLGHDAGQVGRDRPAGCDERLDEHLSSRPAHLHHEPPFQLTATSTRTINRFRPTSVQLVFIGRLGPKQPHGALEPRRRFSASARLTPPKSPAPRAATGVASRPVTNRPPRISSTHGRAKATGRIIRDGTIAKVATSSRKYRFPAARFAP